MRKFGTDISKSEAKVLKEYEAREQVKKASALAKAKEKENDREALSEDRDS